MTEGNAAATPPDNEAWRETVHLLRSPANARRLMAAVARDRASAPPVTKTNEEPHDLPAEK
ncbi:hypothetical protein ACIQUQ_24195 [Streptomyces sp. NPDC101118]|uniref:hypothetical protein n=1 Tax=Streptomyces sp. NPDC101118 TaxID=3366109 RepID=UPI003817ECCF